MQRGGSLAVPKAFLEDLQKDLDEALNTVRAYRVLLENLRELVEHYEDQVTLDGEPLMPVKALIEVLREKADE